MSDMAKRLREWAEYAERTPVVSFTTAYDAANHIERLERQLAEIREAVEQDERDLAAEVERQRAQRLDQLATAQQAVSERN